MRTSTLVTISLPSALRSASERVAKKNHMTRSELVRVAIRRYLEESEMEEAVRVAEHERKMGKLKRLRKGGLVSLMKA